MTAMVKSRHLPTERPGEGATYCAGSCIRNFMEDPDPETKIAENLPKSADILLSVLTVITKFIFIIQEFLYIFIVKS